MKLLFFAPAFPPPMEGGSVVYLYNIVSHLPPSDVVVYTQAHPEAAVFDSRQAFTIYRDSRRFENWSRWEQAGAVVRWAWDVISVVRRHDLNILHADCYYTTGLVAWMVGRLLGKPYVVYTYGEEIAQQLRCRPDLWGKLRGEIYRRIIRDADGLIAVSDYTAGLLVQMGASREKIRKILPMISETKCSDSRTAALVRRKFRIPEGCKIVLTGGRLIARKGHDRLIRAMPRILDACPGTLLIVTSRGPEMENLKACVRTSGVDRHVVFTGFVTDEELSMLYELCEVFAMPHRETMDGDTEGCPTVFLEANAHGKPVVGGGAGGVADAILDGETGFIVDGEDPDAIADAVARLLRDPDLARRMGENGRRRVVESLTPQKGAEQVLEISRRILRARERS